MSRSREKFLSRPLSRRSALKLMGGAAGMAALAACAPAAAPAGEAGESAAPGAEKVTLTFGRHWEAAFRPHQEEFDQMYMEKHPEVEIEITYNTWADHNQVVPTWAAANTLPDIIYIHGSRAFPWAFEGITIPVQAYVDADEEFNVDGIWEEALRLYRFLGTLHAIPYDHGPQILGYNKDIFDAAGIAYPDESWTLDTLREVASQLTGVKDDLPQWGWFGNLPTFHNNTYYNMTIGGWGGEFLNDEETELLLDSAESRAGMQFWADLIHVDESAPTPAESSSFQGDAWTSGRIGMRSAASWNAPSWTAYGDFNWDVAPFPSGPEGRLTNSFGSGYGITRNSTHPDEAWEYLSEYLSEEGMIFMWGNTGRGSPAREAGYLAWVESPVAPEHAEFFIDALNEYSVTGRPYQTLAAAELGDITARQTTLIQSGETDVDAAIQAIMEEGQPVLDAAAERLKEKTG